MTAPTTHWGKLYGSLCLHPKWLSTPAEGRALWTSALSYCIVIGADGEVPEGVLHMLNAPGSDVATSVEQLLDSGLWVRTEKGYRFHDWQDFQQTVEERKDVRRKRSEAGKASAEARRRARSEPDDNVRSTSVETPAQETPSTPATEKRREEERREEPTPKGAADKDAEGQRADVDAVCNHLADRIEGNGARRPPITKTWRREARLLIDKDGYTLQQIHWIIDWCQTDNFWRTNILSTDKLREKFEQLKLKALSESRPVVSKKQQEIDAFLAAPTPNRLEVTR